MIEIYAKNVDYAQGMLAEWPKQVNQAAGAAINRTITHVKAEVSKEVRKRYIIPAKAVKQALTLKRARASELKGEVKAIGRPTPLAKFRIIKGSSGPLKAQVLKSARPKPVPRLFVGKSKSGFEGAMRRVGQESYPLKTPTGPSVPSMMSMVEAPLTKDAEEFLNKRFLHEVEFRLAKFKAGEGDVFRRKSK